MISGLDHAAPSGGSAARSVEGWPDSAQPTTSALRLPEVYRLHSIQVESGQVRTLVLDGQWLAEPGQFAMLWLPYLDEKPFSLLNDQPLAFAVAAVGPLSRALHRLEVGDRVWARGPFGQGFAPRGRHHWLVGGGYGAAPLLFLARRLASSGDRVRVAIGARSAADLILIEAFRATGAQLHLATEDGSAGHHGRVTGLLATMEAGGLPDCVYGCGPSGMLAAVRAWGQSRGVPMQLAWEAYMRCGLGLCGSCLHEGRLLCREGPVIRYPAPEEAGS